MTQDSESDWRKLFQEMMDERDLRQLQDRADALEGAIFVRYQELERSSDGAEERSAMQEATDALLKVRTEKLGFSRSSGRWAGVTKSEQARL